MMILQMKKLERQQGRSRSQQTVLQLHMWAARFKFGGCCILRVSTFLMGFCIGSVNGQMLSRKQASFLELDLFHVVQHMHTSHSKALAELQASCSESQHGEPRVCNRQSGTATHTAA